MVEAEAVVCRRFGDDNPYVQIGQPMHPSIAVQARMEAGEFPPPLPSEIKSAKETF